MEQKNNKKKNYKKNKNSEKKVNMTQYEFGYKLARLGLIVLFSSLYMFFFIVSRDVINVERDFTSKFYS